MLVCSGLFSDVFSPARAGASGKEMATNLIVISFSQEVVDHRIGHRNQLAWHSRFSLMCLTATLRQTGCRTEAEQSVTEEEEEKRIASGHVKHSSSAQKLVIT
jgi:hypothetical protein